MGNQSKTHPPRSSLSPVWIALLLVSHTLSLTAQSAISAVTIPLILPTALVFDSQGNLYIAETGNHVIRRINTSGNITTIAGNTIEGFSGDNGPATLAQLDSPQGLALDFANNLYIADTHNHRIRKLTASTGILTTIAGTGTPGYSGDASAATAAALNLPSAVAFDTHGNLYIADSANHRIRRIDPTTGIITTTAGTGTQGNSGDSGPAAAAQLDSPNGLAVDAANNLYLADTHNHTIRRIDAVTGVITKIAGTGTLGYSGDGTIAAALALPQGLSIDTSGNLYVADSANHRIRRIDATTGIITTIAGTGTQGYSGDNAPAIAANLDSPRATTASTLITLSDTHNQRLRQVEPNANIKTYAGLGTTIPGTLVLTVPTVIAYGTGSITANLSTTTPATGSITFIDTTANTSNSTTEPLVANTAILPTINLAATTHTITATWPGDATHPAAQSLTSTFSITPQSLIVTPTPVSVLYGQPIPIVTGSATGILSQDASTLTLTFATTAQNLSPTGTYPITANLKGAAAGNYTLTTMPAIITINPAPTITTLTPTTTTLSETATVTLTAQVAPTTSGTPTGNITFTDATIPLATQPINATGASALTTSALTAGTHPITAVYSGDHNFTASASAPVILTISGGTSPAADFTLAVTGSTTQTVSAGSPANFTLTALSQGNLSSAINLTASGLPNGATGSFNPAYLPPGATTVTLTITTPSTLAQSKSINTVPLALAFILVPFAALRRIRHPALLAIGLTVFTSLTTGCGDRTNINSQSATVNSYAITVTGTATSPTGAVLTHTATINLSIQSAQ